MTLHAGSTVGQRVWREPAIAVVLALVVAGMATVGAVPAFAQFGVSGFDVQTLEADGTAAHQAAGHPYEMTTTINFNTRAYPGFPGVNVPVEDARTIEVDLPPGVIGDPSATPRCPVVDLNSDECPHSTQVGIASLDMSSITLGVAAVYNLIPPPNEPALFGFVSPAGPILIHPSVRSTGDYGLKARLTGVSQGIGVNASTLTLWGVPSDARHDFQRCPNVDANVVPPACTGTDDKSAPHSAGIPQKPFLTNPTACTAPGVGLETRLRIDSWRSPGVFRDASVFSHLPPGLPSLPDSWGTQGGPMNCDRVPFRASLDVEPGTSAPDKPSGYTIRLQVPQNANVDGLSPSHVRDVSVRFPEGLTLNPSAADGLESCTDAQLAGELSGSGECPERAKIGTATVRTPLLSEPLLGGMYVASQKAEDPYRVFFVLKGAGVAVGLKGSVVPDRVTGQMTTNFINNPQLPFEELTLELKGGSRAPLANPTDCGRKTVTASITPWSGAAPSVVTDGFEIACPAPHLFEPGFDAGTTNPLAGAFAPFVTSIVRPDGSANVTGLQVELPSGILAAVGDVPLCPDVAASAGECPADSRIGTVTAEAGAGPDPFAVTGPVSLTGAYNGAPYGLVASVRAVAGPYDLGKVVVRQALHVDPNDAHVTVVSDPLPSILEGIPLRLKKIHVGVDRPSFTVNPTSCARKTVTGRLSSPGGDQRAVDVQFEVGDCQALPVKPAVSLSLRGRNHLRAGTYPGLHAVLRQPSGVANLSKVVTELPLALALEPEHAKALCEFEDGQRVACPAASIVGSVRAVSPLLRKPLSGPVYFVKGVRFDRRTGRRIRTLPTLLMPLRGEVALNLRATTSVRKNKLVTTFDRIPDAAVTRFDLKLKGGRSGILVVTAGANMCRTPPFAAFNFVAHSGGQLDRRLALRVPCGKRRQGRN